MHPSTHTHIATHMHTEHDGSVDAVSVSEDGLRILVGTSSVSLSTVCNALYNYIARNFHWTKNFAKFS